MILTLNAADKLFYSAGGSQFCKNLVKKLGLKGSAAKKAMESCYKNLIEGGSVWQQFAQNTPFAGACNGFEECAKLSRSNGQAADARMRQN